MKIAVVGYGSIGKRHAQNLHSLGHEVFPIDVGDLLDFNVDCAFICVPTQYHADVVIEYITRGVPIFVEKPLAHDLESIDRIVAAIESKKVINMVGCNMRFHPAALKAKSLAEGRKVMFARAEFGYYLPFWRKHDYTKSYSASEYGGIVIDDIHEIDLLYWLFGEFKAIRLLCDKVSPLQIKREDVSEVAILFESNVVASIHQDYLMKNYHRILTLTLPHETITFKLHPTNLMFKKEVEYFLDCVVKGKDPMNGIKEAAYVLRETLQAKSSGDYSSPVNV